VLDGPDLVVDRDPTHVVTAAAQRATKSKAEWQQKPFQ
jgi:hypothetical protein